jgi:predicted component of type VI protein secretion system
LRQLRGPGERETSVYPKSSGASTRGIGGTQLAYGMQLAAHAALGDGGSVELFIADETLENIEPSGPGSARSGVEIGSNSQRVGYDAAPRMLPLVIQIERLRERVAETCAFAHSPIRIGRNPLNDVELDDGYVSQWHGVIRFDEKHTTYLDLGSTNPSMVDGKPIERNQEVTITESTDLRIGQFRLHVIRVDAPPELFGVRRKTAFARTGVGDASSVAATMFFGGEPTKLRSKAQMAELVASALSGPPPVAAQAPPSRHGPSAPAASAAVLVQSPLRSQPPPPVYPSSARPSGSSSPPPLPGSKASSTSLRAAANAPAVGVAQASNPAPARMDSQPVPVGSSDSLRQAYDDYRRSWRALLAELRYRLERSASARRSDMLDQLVQQYPDIGREAEFRSLISELGLSPLRTGVPEMEDWLRRLTDNMFPPPNASINLALAMERIGEVLEVFSTAYVEMRDAHGRFCDEMSLEKPPADSMLQTTKNPRLVLAYLLNPSSEGASKVEELARSMADFALHQVALVSAVVEGARGVLQELSPEAVQPKGKSKGKQGQRGLFASMFSNEAETLWQKYRGVFAEMVDEDRFTRRLFGRPFARKYYAIMGGRRSITPDRTG